MKKLNEIMKEMGFRKDAPDSLKEAFVRHLVKAATGVAVQPGPSEQKSINSGLTSLPTQLEFDLSGTDEKKVS